MKTSKDPGNISASTIRETNDRILITGPRMDCVTERLHASLWLALRANRRECTRSLRHKDRLGNTDVPRVTHAGDKRQLTDILGVEKEEISFGLR